MTTLTLTDESVLLIKLAIEHYTRDIEAAQVSRARALRDKGQAIAADHAAIKSQAVKEQAGIVRLAIDCAQGRARGVL